MPVSVEDNFVTLSLPESPSTSIKVLKFGATAVSWKVNGEERLWLSENSHLDGSKAVRGGIPLVFPRFGPPKPEHKATAKLPQHGFARNVEWEFLGQINESSIQFGLGPEMLTDAFRDAWPYDFTLLITFSLASATKLELKFEVQNPGQEAFDFNVLFHTYFRVPDVRYVQITGLNNLKYRDQVFDLTETSVNEPLTIEKEVDRIFEKVPHHIHLDYKASPYVTIHSSATLTDTVVWNPWTDKANSLSDFTPKEGFHQMVCIETGKVCQFVTLEKGQNWIGSVTYTAS